MSCGQQQKEAVLNARTYSSFLLLVITCKKTINMDTHCRLQLILRVVTRLYVLTIIQLVFTMTMSVTQ